MHDWPGVAEPGDRDLRGRGVDVAVGLDDDGRVVAELEADLLPRRARLDAPADLGGPGERDERDVGVVDDRVADRCRRCRSPRSRWPLGRPHSSRSSSARAMADSGVCDAGFSTTGHPAAIAGASLCATRLSGKLNGLIAPTTPMGTRSVNPSLPSPTSDASSGTISPASRRASTDANVNVDTARFASTRAVLIGLAASSAMMRANSSVRSTSRCAARSRISARCHGASGARRRAVRGQRHRPRDLLGTARRDAVDLVAVVGRAHHDLVAGAGRTDAFVADREGAHGKTAFRGWETGQPAEGWVVSSSSRSSTFSSSARLRRAPQISSSASSRARTRSSTSDGVTIASSP